MKANASKSVTQKATHILFILVWSLSFNASVFSLLRDILILKIMRQYTLNFIFHAQNKH